MTQDFSWPGKPTDNGCIEAFNSKFPVECLNVHWFLTLADARQKDGGLAQRLHDLQKPFSDLNGRLLPSKLPDRLARGNRLDSADYGLRIDAMMTVEVGDGAGLSEVLDAE